MPRDLRAYLWDVIEAATDIQTFMTGKTASDYCHDPLLKAGVERKFEIAGEALAQASKLFPDQVSSIRDRDQIIAFRNRLIHGYSTVSDTLVWDVIENHLPKLKSDAESLLKSINKT